MKGKLRNPPVQAQIVASFLLVDVKVVETTPPTVVAVPRHIPPPKMPMFAYAAMPPKPMRTIEAKQLRSRPDHLARSKRRRAQLVALKLCINGISHGPATHGGLCRRCRAVHNGVPIEQIPEVVVDPVRDFHDQDLG